MATFGSQINPSLGAVNYAPFMQGAMVGSQAVGQGIASLGRNVGAGIAQYKEVQKQNKEKEAVVKAGIKSLESLAQLPGIDANVVKAVSPLLQIANDPNASLVQKEAAIRNGINQFNTVIGLGQQAAAQRMKERELAVSEQNALANLQQANAGIMAARRERGGGKAIDPVSVRSVGPNGEPIEVSVDRITGQVISQGPVSQPKYVRSPQEEAEAAGLIETIKRDVAFLDTIPQQAVEADSNQNTVNELRDLLNRDTTQTGSLQGYITDLRSLGKRLGFPDADLADQQRMESLISEDPLRQTQQFLKGQGQVSNAERDRIDRLALNANKDKKALLELLDYRDALAARARGAEQERQRLFDSGKKAGEIAEGIRRWYSKNTVTKILSEQRKAREEDFTEALNIISGK